MVEREGQRERRRDPASGVNGPFKAVNQPFLPALVLSERGGSAPAETLAPTLISFDNLGIDQWKSIRDRESNTAGGSGPFD